MGGYVTARPVKKIRIADSKYTRKACIVQIQDTKSTQPASFVEKKRARETGDHQSKKRADVKIFYNKKELFLRSDLFEF